MKTIQLCYRKIINAATVGAWEKLVFDDSYTEYLMQAQFYDSTKQYAHFSALLATVPAAEKLHFLVGTSIVGYLQQLNGVFPDVSNALGIKCIPFKNFRFEIIDTDVHNKASHAIAVNFISEPLLWHETVHNNLLISIKTADEGAQGYLTEMITLQPFLSIYSLKTD